MKAFALACSLLLLSVAPASAGLIVGPGDITATAGDGAFDIIAVDLNSPITLGPGTYKATLFNYQFTDFAGFQTTGTIAPVLLTGSGTLFTPVAVGDTLTYGGATAFTSVAFGGSDSFTLASSTTVYGGLYWEATYSGGPELRMPVGYADGGNSFVVYGGGFGPGANAPVVGTAISGSAEGFFSRTYDFSIEIEDAAVVAEPASAIVALVGVVVIAFRQTRRQHRHVG
jgi:hypothetical protein